MIFFILFCIWMWFVRAFAVFFFYVSLVICVCVCVYVCVWGVRKWSAAYFSLYFFWVLFVLSGKVLLSLFGPQTASLVRHLTGELYCISAISWSYPVHALSTSVSSEWGGCCCKQIESESACLGYNLQWCVSCLSTSSLHQQDLNY